MTAQRLGMLVAGLVAPFIVVWLAAPIGAEGGRSDIGQFWYVAALASPVLLVGAVLLIRRTVSASRIFGWGIATSSGLLLLMSLVVLQAVSGT